MNLGLYLDLRNPPGWRQDPTRVHGFALELCEEAEHLGLHSVWLTEHHQFEDGYLCQPLTMAAAIAARTSRIRVGTAVLLAPLHEAAEIAEQAALVDVISGGRLDLGLGAGYRQPEFDLYGGDLKRRFGTTDSRVGEIRSLWAQGGITPQPVQNPLPIWMGYHGPQGARRAGLLGEGLLAAYAGLYEPYRQGLIDGGHDPADARMAGWIQGWVTDDPERDWDAVAPYVAYQIDSYGRYAVEGTGQPPPPAVDPLRLRNRQMRAPTGYFLYGDPVDAAKRIATFTDGAPVETVFMWASVGGMPESMVVQSLQTLGTKVAPLLRLLPDTSRLIGDEQ